MSLFLVSEPLGSGPVIGVVVLILIILVIVAVAFYARSKGILCFSGKSHSKNKQRMMHVLCLPVDRLLAIAIPSEAMLRLI